MSDQFNNFENQQNDPNRQNPDQSKWANSENNDQNQSQSQGQNPYQQSMNPNLSQSL